MARCDACNAVADGCDECDGLGHVCDLCGDPATGSWAGRCAACEDHEEATDGHYLRSALHDLISEMDDKPWPDRYLHVGTIAAVLTETDDGAVAPGESPSLSPEAVAPAAPSSPVLAGQREQIAALLDKWFGASLRPFVLEEFLAALMPTLVDLSSEETRVAIHEVLRKALDEYVNGGYTAYYAYAERAVLAALTSWEQP